MEKLLVVYENNKPILKFYVNPSNTIGDIQNYFDAKFPNREMNIYNNGVIIDNYDYEQITNGKIVLTPRTFKRSIYDWSGEELVRQTAADPRFREILFRPENNDVWINVLRKDYNIDYFGDNAYRIYMKKVSRAPIDKYSKK